MISVRNLHPGEELPPGAFTGFEAVTLTPEWVWVAETEDGRVVGAILCAGAHQFVYLLRIVAYPKAPAAWLLATIRKAARSCTARGYIGFMAHVSLELEPERKLAEIVGRAQNGVTRHLDQVVICGATLEGVSGVEN